MAPCRSVSRSRPIFLNPKSILVGGWPTPLKNMRSSVGMMTFPTEWKNHPNVWNHQPESFVAYNQNHDFYSYRLWVLVTWNLEWHAWGYNIRWKSMQQWYDARCIYVLKKTPAWLHLSLTRMGVTIPSPTQVWQLSLDYVWLHIRLHINIPSGGSKSPLANQHWFFSREVKITDTEWFCATWAGHQMD